MENKQGNKADTHTGPHLQDTQHTSAGNKESHLNVTLLAGQVVSTCAIPRNPKTQKQSLGHSRSIRTQFGRGEYKHTRTLTRTRTHSLAGRKSIERKRTRQQKKSKENKQIQQFPYAGLGQPQLIRFYSYGRESTFF